MRPRRKGQGELPYDYLLALKGFSILRAHGVATLDAVRAIEEAFPAISKLANKRGKIPKLRVRLVASRGKVRAATGRATAKSDTDEVGHIELNFSGIAGLLAFNDVQAVDDNHLESPPSASSVQKS
jgi:hypothetical protein